MLAEQLNTIETERDAYKAETELLGKSLYGAQAVCTAQQIRIQELEGDRAMWALERDAARERQIELETQAANVRRAVDDMVAPSTNGTRAHLIAIVGAEKPAGEFLDESGGDVAKSEAA